jgi:hypothetical protein
MALPITGQLSVSLINLELGRASSTAARLGQLADLVLQGSIPSNNRNNPKNGYQYI